MNLKRLDAVLHQGGEKLINAIKDEMLVEYHDQH